MPEVITVEDIIRATFACAACVLCLYYLDRAIWYHACLFREEFSGSTAAETFKRRPHVFAGRLKIGALAVTTLAFGLTVLMSGASYWVIAITVLSFLTYAAISLFQTLRELKRLQPGR